MSHIQNHLHELKNHPKQKEYLQKLTLFFGVLAVLCCAYWFVYSRHYIETDNAYVNGNIIPVTAQINGLVTAVTVNDTHFVTEGSPLVLLDETDKRIALEKAKANLALVLRQTQQLYINDRGLRATVDARSLRLKQANSDLSRRQQAIHIGGVSKEDLIHAQDGLDIAQTMLTTAQAQWGANKTLITGASVMGHPSVVQAIAQVKEAYLALARTTIKAPVSGLIAKRAVQVGQVVSPGNLLMAIVPLDQIWVDANFKEKQLRNVHPGQSVLLHADLYGSSVVYHGHVEGLSGGTGSAFSLLPAQNATGNWIKIVQRLPVRIALDPKELEEHPLRIGLSMEVTIDTSAKNNKSLSHSIVSRTNIFERLDKGALPIIEKIIHDNYDANSEHVPNEPKKEHD